MSESYENLKVDLDEFISNFKAVDGQTGAVIIIDGEIKGFELFLNSQIYHEYHEKILKSYLIDIDIDDSVFTVNTDVAKNLIEEALSVEYAAKKSNGLEEAFEFENSEGLGTAYFYKDELIHMSYFKNDTEITKKEVADELSRLRGLGFEVIPKLNFSSSHDEWMGKYSRMVSTPEYYKVCDDVIDEVCELFGNPGLFHLGMDEEVSSVQEGYTYTVVREGNFYWHDQNRLFKRVERTAHVRGFGQTTSGTQKREKRCSSKI
jgi:hypothetical protein